MAPDDLNRINPLPGRPHGPDPGIFPADLPTDIAARYYTKTRFGVPFAFYRDAVSREPTFRDNGSRLSTERHDPNVVRDLLAIARHRQWETIAVRGETTFRREVWMQARVAGLDVRGYRPTERDDQELARRRQRQPTQAPPAAPPIEELQIRDRRTPAQTCLHVVEAVVRRRIVEPEAQAQVLAAARERLAGWLERGARRLSPKTREPTR